MDNHDRISRRHAVKLGLGGLAGLGSAGWSAAQAAAEATPPSKHRLLTPAHQFEDVSRGKPIPHTLKGEALTQAKLTPETWRLEITADAAVHEGISQAPQLGRELTLANGTALDYQTLLDLGKKHRVMFLKAMQCLNIATPLGQGLWEGVPLREVLHLCGKLVNVRRIYFWGYHNNDPAQLFQSSLSYSQVMETPPGELPVFLAYRLNGEPLSLPRGGPVRMVVPWAHGFKSIKWLQHIVLTNDYRANDTYAEKNNDPESHLKTAAYMDDVAAKTPAGQPVTVSGLAISGWSGLDHIEYWLRPAPEKPGDLAEDDPAWETATWQRCEVDTPPQDWSALLPAGVSSSDILGFDPKTGRPLTWPLRYGMVGWSVRLRDLRPGTYEVRARAVDLNGFAQPEPRSMLKTGKNGIQFRRFEVTA